MEFAAKAEWWVWMLDEPPRPCPIQRRQHQVSLRAQARERAHSTPAAPTHASLLVELLFSRDVSSVCSSSSIAWKQACCRCE